jgi:hypothetical protein
LQSSPVVNPNRQTANNNEVPFFNLLSKDLDHDLRTASRRTDQHPQFNDGNLTHESDFMRANDELVNRQA